MKANELRIGNWYNSVKFNQPVICGFEDFYELELYCDGASIDEEIIMTMFEPIPLTEEWLLKFGFYRDKTKPRSLAWCLDDRHSHWPYKVWFYGETIIKLGRDYYAYAQYVHQLQNLYFALTGEELTINA